MFNSTANAQATELSDVSAQDVSYVGVMLGERERKINRALQADAKLDHFETRFTDVLEELKATYRIPIVLHESALENNLDEDSLITLKLSGISLKSALQVMLKPFSCTCAIKDEIMYILADDAALDMLEVRIYDCTALKEKINAPNVEYDSIEKVVTTIVDPQSWIESGGNGRIVELAGRLIICQTNDRHDQIAKLLKSLDEEFTR